MDALLLGEAGFRAPLPPDLVELGLTHEEQHQELMVTDLKHLLSHNPLRPVYAAGRRTGGPAGGATPESRDQAAAPTDGGPSARRPAGPPWIGFEAGVREIGHAGPRFAFDNESPRHRVFLEDFELAGRPVTVGEYLAFMEEDGYGRPELWLSDGWAMVTANQWRAPLYWHREEEGWWQFTLSGYRPVATDEPVTHLSYFEADACARWAGARLPTEAEWEVAAVQGPSVDGPFLDDGLFHPVPRNRGAGFSALLGGVWEWTQSAYGAYPGYRPVEGALGEYNAKFMSGQMVLRGGSCATPAGHVRPTYRNFFPPSARWQFSGIRLAR
jgi:ergothioneine biosynthesis protein EgtB